MLPEPVELPNGVYVDATYHDEDGSGAVGMVVVQNGYIIDIRASKVLPFLNSDDAEREAVDYARELFPDATIYTDSMHAAEDCDARYIPRKLNWKAHSTARRAYRGEYLIDAPKRAHGESRNKNKLKLPGAKCRRRNLCVFRGRGVAPFVPDLVLA